MSCHLCDTFCVAFSFPSNSDTLQLIPVMVQHQRRYFLRASWVQSWQWLTLSCWVVTPITAEELSPKCQLCCLLKWNCAAGRGSHGGPALSCEQLVTGVFVSWSLSLSVARAPPHEVRRRNVESRVLQWVLTLACCCLPLPGWGMCGIQLNMSVSGFGHKVTCASWEMPWFGMMSVACVVLWS